MIEIYHHPICPYSRKIRIILREKGMDFELLPEKFWERRKPFLKLNPSGNTPVVVFEGEKAISGNNALYEYVEEKAAIGNKLVFGTPEEKAQIRKLNEWFDNKFYNEVTKYIVNEKVIKIFTRSGEPNSEAIRAAKNNILYHLDYIGFCVRNNRYLCGDTPSLADFSAAAQISVLDFVGDVPWKHNEKAKEWYSLMKSRPSFKSILQDKISFFKAPVWYADLDF